MRALRQARERTEAHVREPCRQSGAPVTGISLSETDAPVPLARETDAHVLPRPSPPQRVVTGRDRDWGNQSAILSESGLWQAAPNPRASLTQPD